MDAPLLGCPAFTSETKMLPLFLQKLTFHWISSNSMWFDCIPFKTYLALNLGLEYNRPEMKNSKQGKKKKLMIEPRIIDFLKSFEWPIIYRSRQIFHIWNMKYQDNKFIHSHETLWFCFTRIKPRYERITIFEWNETQTYVINDKWYVIQQ